jgi:hypothetical protein
MPKLSEIIAVANTKIKTAGGLADFPKIRLAGTIINVTRPIIISLRP